VLRAINLALGIAAARGGARPHVSHEDPNESASHEAPNANRSC
jgi:hypothetical protein